MENESLVGKCLKDGNKYLRVLDFSTKTVEVFSFNLAYPSGAILYVARDVVLLPYNPFDGCTEITVITVMEFETAWCKALNGAVDAFTKMCDQCAKPVSRLEPTPMAKPPEPSGIEEL